MVEPEVIFDGIYVFKGNPIMRVDSICFLKVLKRNSGFVVLATEHPENKGASLTNGAEYIATQVVAEFGIPTDKLTWIEHYRHSEVFEDETFDKVEFLWKGNIASSPVWTPLPKLTVGKILGE